MSNIQKITKNTDPSYIQIKTIKFKGKTQLAAILIEITWWKFYNFFLKLSTAKRGREQFPAG